MNDCLNLVIFEINYDSKFIFTINGINIEINPNNSPKNNNILAITANIFGNLSFLLRNIIMGRAINDNTAAIMIYTKTDCILNKKQNRSTIPKMIAIARKIPLVMVFEFIGVNI